LGVSALHAGLGAHFELSEIRSKEQHSVRITLHR
jgi:hypothetical protein